MLALGRPRREAYIPRSPREPDFLYFRRFATSRVQGARIWTPLILPMAALSMLGLALYLGWMLSARQPEVVRRLSARE